MLSCAGTDRLQTGMRGAFGKPQGTVERVHIGQPIMSVRCKDNHKAVSIEALGEENSSSLDAKRFSSQRSGDSLNGIVMITSK